MISSATDRFFRFTLTCPPPLSGLACPAGIIPVPVWPVVPQSLWPLSVPAHLRWSFFFQPLTTPPRSCIRSTPARSTPAWSTPAWSTLCDQTIRFRADDSCLADDTLFANCRFQENF